MPRSCCCCCEAAAIGVGGAVIVGAWISHKDNGALEKLIFGGKQYWDGGSNSIKNHEPAVLETGMTEADLSNRGLGTGGAVIVGAWISHKDNGALTSLNLATNNLRVEGAKHIAEAIRLNVSALRFD